MHYDDRRLPREQLLAALEQIEGGAARHRRHRGRLAHRAPAAVVGRSGDAPRDREVHAVGAPRRALVPEQHRVHPPHQRPRHDRGRAAASSSTRATWCSGLGDVYLGAPVATPLDPRHRLVTTKYNPARTWTPENAVGIGGAYLCVYGMEGPGGYQFVGRTCQMWNRFHETRGVPARHALAAALLRSDPLLSRCSEQELLAFRAAFPRGRVGLKIEETTFRFADYRAFLDANAASIEAFRVAPARGVRRRARALGVAAAAAGGRRRARGGRETRSRRARSPSAPPSPAASGRSRFPPAPASPRAIAWSSSRR